MPGDNRGSAGRAKMEIKPESSEPFEYNQTGSINIAFDEKLIPIDQIKADGYELGANHRPIRTAHVNKIKSTFSGDLITIKVVFDSRDSYYHIIQGQHVFTALTQLINEGKIEPKDTIKCDVIKRKSTNIQLDASKFEDRSQCFEYSFRVTEGQEKNCISDTINMVIELSERYERETGKIHGIIDYIFQNQYGYQKLSKETIKLYKNYGESLRRLGLLEQAQRERWVINVIDSVIKSYKLRSKRMKEIKIKLPDMIANELIKKGLANSDLWIEAYEKNHVIKGNIKIFIEK